MIIIVIASAIAASAGQVADNNDIFRSDGADAAEILRYRALTTVYVPFTLSGGMNRSLLYGNTAWNRYPESAAAPGVDFFYSPWWAVGNDLVAPTQTGLITADMWDGVLYHPYPNVMTSPELYIFWENGVFNQNTLNVRLSRPLSPNVMFSVFSNYRYFAGTQFNHEGNDVANFYKFFYADTTKVMNRGYNPSVDEHAMGASLLRTGEDSSKIFASFSYVNFQNEYALNIPAFSPERLNWAALDRRVYRIDAALTDKKVLSSNTNLRLSFVNEKVGSSYRPDTAVANFDFGTKNFIAEADITTPVHLGARAGTLLRNIDNHDGSADNSAYYHTGLFYNRDMPNALGRVSLKTYADATAQPCEYGESCVNVDIHTGAGMELRPKNGALTRLSAYAKSDYIRTAGAEAEIEFKYFGALFGYQLTDTYGDFSAFYYSLLSWPQYAPPYEQPGHTFVIAPWTKRIGGFSLLSKAFITDTKPHLKASVHLSQIIRPKDMAHTFEFELGFDYWSERDTMNFAGFYEWSDEVFDVNLKVAAHIKSFRLFYKIDNLLNRRQAYIPGYFSPGVTFRWGINWLIN